MTKNQGCDLYRILGEGGELLYVGISLNVAKRMSEHRSEKSWWDEVTDIKREHYSTRETALEVESRTIKREQPKYNVMHNSEAPSPNGKLVMMCHGCGKSVADGKGWVHLLGDVGAYQKQVEEFNELYVDKNGFVNGGDWLFGHPDMPKWVVHHSDCDPDPDGGEYFIDVHRINTWRSVAHWSAHLSQKNWFADTDWTDFVYELERHNGGIQ